MVGKLIKYEIRSSLKLIAVIWAALIVASLLLSLINSVFMDKMPNGFVNTGVADAIGVLSVFLLIALFTALVVVTVMIVIMRFYKGMLGDEGYLMHTLPVKPWQLITSKGLVTCGVVLISIIVAMIAIVIMSGISGGMDVALAFKELGGICRENPIYILIFLEGLIVIVLSLMKSIYQIYASLAIGQIAGKHRILLSLGAYIGINMILFILGFIFMNIASELSIFEWINKVVVSNEYTSLERAQVVITGIFLLTAIQLAAFHVITERILSKKLNLQ